MASRIPNTKQRGEMSFEQPHSTGEKKRIHCSECEHFGHNATNYKKNHVDFSTCIPEGRTWRSGKTLHLWTGDPGFEPAFPSPDLTLCRSFRTESQTGFFTLFCIRNFDGTRLTEDPSQVNIMKLKKYLLHEMLESKENRSRVPAAFVHIYHKITLFG